MKVSASAWPGFIAVHSFQELECDLGPLNHKDCSASSFLNHLIVKKRDPGASCGGDWLNDRSPA